VCSSDLAIGGNWAAFLIWLGGCAVAGWIVTLLMSPDQEGRMKER